MTRRERKRKIFYLFLGSFFIASMIFFPTPTIADSENEYNCEVNVDDSITWKILGINRTVLTEIRETFGLQSFMKDEDYYNKSDAVKFTITRMDEAHSYVEMEYNIYINDLFKSSGEQIEIETRPEEHPNIDIISFDYIHFSVILSDPEQYISDLCSIEDSMDRYTLVNHESGQFSILRSEEENEAMARFEYSENGILEKYLLLYNNHSAYELKLLSYTTAPEEDFILPIIIISVVIMLIFIPLGFAALSKSSGAMKKAVEWKEQIDNENEAKVNQQKSNPYKLRIAQSESVSKTSAESVICAKYELNDDDFFWKDSIRR